MAGYQHWPDPRLRLRHRLEARPVRLDVQRSRIRYLPTVGHALHRNLRTGADFQQRLSNTHAVRPGLEADYMLTFPISQLYDTPHRNLGDADIEQRLSNTHAFTFSEASEISHQVRLGGLRRQELRPA